MRLRVTFTRHRGEQKLLQTTHECCVIPLKLEQSVNDVVFINNLLASISSSVQWPREDKTELVYWMY